jgi:hypothetical protein
VEFQKDGIIRDARHGNCTNMDAEYTKRGMKTISSEIDGGLCVKVAMVARLY